MTQERRILSMFFDQRMNTAEIGKSLGMSEPEVDEIIHREICRRTMQRRNNDRIKDVKG